MATKVSLHRLTLQNFRSFEGKHTVDFDETGLYLVRGFNLDTRGESAAGKSTLFHAIAYALDFAPYAATEYRSWLNEEPMFVELELKTAKGIVTIHRGDKLWLKRAWEDKPITSAKAVAEALDELCGMGKQLRSAITYRKQRTFGIFMSKKDKEKKEFLVDLLKLEWLEKDIAEAVKRVTASEEQVVRSEAGLNPLERQLEEARAHVPKNAEIDTASMKKEVLHWRLTLERATKMVEEKQGELADAKAEEEKRADEAYHSNDVEIAALEEEIKVIQNAQSKLEDSRLKDAVKVLGECQQRVSRVAHAESEAAEYRTELAQLEAEMEHLLVLTCPKCLREWREATEEAFNVKKRIGVLKEALRSADEDVATLTKLRLLEKKLLDDVAREREVLKAEGDLFRSRQREQIAEIRSRISVLGSRASQKRSEVMFDPDNASKRIGKELASFIEQRDMALLKLNSVSMQLDRAIQENEFNKREHDRRFKEVVTIAAAVAKWKKDHEELVKAWNAERDYLEMQRGFLGKYFSEVLVQISQKANKILASLPNAKRVTVRFDTDRKTQEGNVRNEITPVAMFSGKEWPLEAGASGGMFTSIELAVDLAVIEVIEERTGIELGWLILDESFANGSDNVTKQGCLEILQRYAQKKLVIMVEHASEFKEFFSRVIEIEFKDERSCIR